MARPLFACPCCGESTLGEREAFEICVVCFWEDDPVQSEDPDFEGGGNALSLKAAGNQTWRRVKMPVARFYPRYFSPASQV